MNDNIQRSITEILNFAKMIHLQRRSFLVDPHFWPPDNVVKSKLKEAIDLRNLLTIATQQIERNPKLQDKLTFHAFLINELSKFIVEAKQVISSHTVYKEDSNIVLEDAAGNKYIALYFTPLPPEEDQEDGAYELYVKDYNYRDHPEPPSYNQAVFENQDLLKRYPYIFTIRLNFRAVLQVSHLFDKNLTKQAMDAARSDYLREQQEKSKGKDKHEQYN